VGHEDWVNALCMIDEGKLASGSSDNKIKVQKVESGGKDIVVKVWNLTKFECVKTLEHPNRVQAIVFVEKDKLVSGCDDGKLRVSCATLTVVSHEPEIRYSSVFTIDDTVLVCPSKVFTHSYLVKFQT